MLKNAFWLKKNIDRKNIKVLDASWYLPNINRDAKKEFHYSRIPGAIYFDIEDICDKKSKLPHMLPNQKYFEKKVSSLGIESNHTVIIYCKEGVLSSPRVWWMFKYYGHEKVFILNGGFKAWSRANGKSTSGPKKYINSHSKYKVGRIQSSLNVTYEQIMISKKYKKKINILDARPKRRFLELEAEPRINIGKGKIEGSINLEASLLDTKGHFKKKNEIRNIYKRILEKKYKTICSCGSGVSACAIAFTLNLIGNKNWSIYDGSWTEWYLKSKN